MKGEIKMDTFLQWKKSFGQTTNPKILCSLIASFFFAVSYLSCQTASAASIDCADLNGKAGIFVKTNDGWKGLDVAAVSLGNNELAFKPRNINRIPLSNGVLVVKISENYAVSGNKAEGLKSRKHLEDRYPNATVQMWRQGLATTINNCTPFKPSLFPTTVKLGTYIDYHRNTKDNLALRNFHSKYTADREGGLRCLRTDDDGLVPNTASASRSNRDQFLFDEKARKPNEKVARVREFSLFGAAFAAEARPRLVVKTLNYDLGIKGKSSCPRFAISIKNKVGILQIADLEGRDAYSAHFRKKYVWDIK
jgi:hypothetical protein